MATSRQLDPSTDTGRRVRVHSMALWQRHQAGAVVQHLQVVEQVSEHRPVRLLLDRDAHVQREECWLERTHFEEPAQTLRDAKPTNRYTRFTWAVATYSNVGFNTRCVDNGLLARAATASQHDFLRNQTAMSNARSTCSHTHVRNRVDGFRMRGELRVVEVELF